MWTHPALQGRRLNLTATEDFGTRTLRHLAFALACLIQFSELEPAFKLAALDVGTVELWMLEQRLGWKFSDEVKIMWATSIWLRWHK